ncbi:hypothetical protein MD484_g5201, partial [Candolleomyces efflorescens]
MSRGPSPTATPRSPSWATVERTVLTSIFQHLQYARTDESSHESIRPNRPYYGLVCKAWHGVWSTEPYLLARRVIYVDIEPTHEKLQDGTASSKLPNYISKTYPNDFEMYLLRKVKAPAIGTLYPDPKEKSTIDNILDALVPHSHRMVGLFIEASASSSLPSTSDLLSANSRFVLGKLKSLMLTSFVGKFDDPTISRVQPPIPFLRPTALVYLNLDGGNLMLALTHPSHLLLCLPHLTGLCIDHLTPYATGFSMDLVDKLFGSIISNLTQLRTLAFNEFEMPLHAIIQPSGPRPPYHLNRLIIGMTASPSMQYILDRFTHPAELILSSCYFTLPQVTLPKSSRLVLQSVVDFELLPTLRLGVAASTDLLPDMILKWDGPDLEFNSCTALDDAFLTRFVEAMMASNSGQSLRNLKNLKIVDCSKFSADAIIKFLEFRKYLNGHHAGGGEAALLCSLEVSGGSPKLETPQQARNVLDLVCGLGSPCWSVV